MLALCQKVKRTPYSRFFPGHARLFRLCQAETGCIKGTVIGSPERTPSSIRSLPGYYLLHNRRIGRFTVQQIVQTGLFYSVSVGAYKRDGCLCIHRKLLFYINGLYFLRRRLANHSPTATPTPRPTSKLRWRRFAAAISGNGRL